MGEGPGVRAHPAGPPTNKMVNHMDSEPFPRPPPAPGLLDAADGPLPGPPSSKVASPATAAHWGRERADSATIETATPLQEPFPHRAAVAGSAISDNGGAGEGESDGAASQAARWYDRGRDPSLPGPRHSRFLDGLNPEAGSLLGTGSLERGLEEARERVHRRLIQELDATRLERLGSDEAHAAVREAARRVIALEAPEVVGLGRDEVVSAVTDEVLGLGPIEPLLRDGSVTEVMVNAPDQVWIERNGRLARSRVHFRDDAHIMRIAERIVSRIGRRVDEAAPMVDARLPDGSRVNIIIPPVALKSPTITIRKFRADKMTLEQLVSVGSITPEAVAFLRACVRLRRNIIVSGGTGSGKTTLLNAVSSAIPDDERLVTIEDPAELRLQQPHVVALEARPPSIEGKNAVSQRDLVRNALRMRPDRIVVGEVRGGEAFDMLQAMNTGHEGSLSTVHANSPRDALARLENMVLMAGMELPLRAVREQIASAVHLLVHLNRFADGSRRVTHISEITGMEAQTIALQDVFGFENEGIDGQGRIRGALRPTGIRPTFAEEFALAGITLPLETFHRPPQPPRWGRTH